MQDSIYFFDQFKIAFLKVLKEEEQKKHDVLLYGRPNFEEICEIRGCLSSIKHFRKVFDVVERNLKERFDVVERNLKEKYELDGDL